MGTRHVDTPQPRMRLRGIVGTLCSSLQHGESGGEQEEKGVLLAMTRGLRGLLESAIKGSESSAVQTAECQKGRL